jgi:hypothetical protein
MVTFTRIPYATAARRAQVQDFTVYLTIVVLVAVLAVAAFMLLH